MAYLLSASPATGALFGYLSAAGFAGMTATWLLFDNLDGIIAQNQIKLPVERHGDGHIGEECFYNRHLAPSLAGVVQIL
jgi:hypothetical protein